MRKSRAITLTVLSGLTLTGCLAATGCGGADRTHRPAEGGPGAPASAERYETPDRTWHDSEGNVVPERWRADEHGNHVLDDQGRPIPEPGVPYDRYGRLWVFVNGLWGPQPVPVGRPPVRTTSPRTGLWLTGGSGYRTTATAPAYRAMSGGVSAPTRPSSPSASTLSSGSSISRSGFGSTGSSSSSSGS